jgi:hypothetical protein
MQLSNDMKDFLEHAYEIVCKSLERYLYQVEEKEARKQEENKIQEIKKKKYQNEFSDRSKFRSILQDLRINSKKLPMINGM